ncbi:MAG: PEP-CTERM sorting domain-containing protein [Phycisphaerae bacterium]|nr:PEP-CTERM sorting domain-containing protein [Phycisphaerae bacterium]
MRKHLLQSRAVFGATALVLGTAVNAWAANLLVNPSFEAPQASGSVNNTITGWTRVNDASRATFRANTGSWAIWSKTFQPIGGGYFQDVNIIAGQSYNFSAFASFEAGFLTITDPVAAEMRLSWRDSGGGQVGTDHVITITPADNPPAGSPAVWIPYSLNNLVAPAGAVQARVSFGWTGGGPGPGAQSMFWDDVVLDGPGTPPVNSWAVAGSGEWNVAGNWTLGTIPNGADATAEFLGIITAPSTVYTDVPRVLGSLNINNANTYVITGAGSLTMQTTTGNALIQVGQGTQKINLPLHLANNTTASVAAGATLLIADPLILNGNTLNKTGAGTLLIEAPVRSSPGGLLRVSNGTLELNFGAGAAATPSSPAQAGTSVVVEGSVARINVDQTLSGLDAVTTNAGDQEIDLRGSRVRVYSANLATTELGIYNDIRAAYESASKRDGIYSSLDDTGTTFSIGVTNQSVDANGGISVQVRLTRTGDANVDGTANIADFSLLATNFNGSGLWDNGDFNYDGQVNINDFSLLATNFNQSAGDLPRAAVPEPASLTAVGLGLALLARRRRA